MDAGNQQLLGKLLGVEKDLDGKLQGVNDNTNSLVTKLDSLGNGTKNNSQTIVNLQESIYIQTEPVAGDVLSCVKTLENESRTLGITLVASVGKGRQPLADAVINIEDPGGKNRSVCLLWDRGKNILNPGDARGKPLGGHSSRSRLRPAGRCYLSRFASSSTD